MTTTTAPTTKRPLLAALCFHLDPSQMATLIAMLEDNAQDGTEDGDYPTLIAAIREELDGNCGEEESERYLARARVATNPTPTSKYQVLYEDPTQGWMPTNLGIFTDSEEAKEAGRNWLEGYATRGQEDTRIALQTIEPQPLPQGATLI